MQRIYIHTYKHLWYTRNIEIIRVYVYRGNTISLSLNFLFSFCDFVVCIEYKFRARLCYGWHALSAPYTKNLRGAN